MIREFDGNALYPALDAKRRAEGLSWAAAAAAIWDMAPAHRNFDASQVS